MGAVLVSLEDYARLLRLLRQAADHVHRSDVAANVTSDVAEVMDVAAAVHLLEQQMTAWEGQVGHLRERAKNQLTILFNLMTRYDVASSIAIAKLAKKDSTSMKAITTMTMVFLPGTFFAALFAIPSLQWDASPVIQSNFWFCNDSDPSAIVAIVGTHPRMKTRENGVDIYFGDPMDVYELTTIDLPEFALPLSFRSSLRVDAALNMPDGKVRLFDIFLPTRTPVPGCASIFQPHARRNQAGERRQAPRRAHPRIAPRMIGHLRPMHGTERWN
ncbi:hypothetical protein OQA88_3294 [Cercophora sp. LCS_1]